MQAILEELTDNQIREYEWTVYDVIRAAKENDKTLTRSAVYTMCNRHVAEGKLKTRRVVIDGQVLTAYSNA